MTQHGSHTSGRTTARHVPGTAAARHYAARRAFWYSYNQTEYTSTL